MPFWSLLATNLAIMTIYISPENAQMVASKRNKTISIHVIRICHGKIKIFKQNLYKKVYAENLTGCFVGVRCIRQNSTSGCRRVSEPEVLIVGDSSVRLTTQAGAGQDE